MPDAQKKALRRWRGNLRHRQREESRSAGPRSDEKATGAASDRGAEAPRLDREAVVALVDRIRPLLQDEPLLSALVAGADLSPHGLYRHIRFSHGRERVPDASLEMHWRMEVLELFHLWRHR
ncbi:hypothetical protein [Streptomyces rochei]|uniref:Uncharacterized protein n=1 Tax=Streptomyces rochei TaxID=1928 RepID=A0AAX3ZQQ7_STRRO|nr:hypothetical protein [Streptomyces rochei]WMC89576.1 hypothetical protein P7W03_29985 [Streptomyces rochei]